MALLVRMCSALILSAPAMVAATTGAAAAAGGLAADEALPAEDVGALPAVDDYHISGVLLCLRYTAIGQLGVKYPA